MFTNLNDTVQLMVSDDYKERFIAEYWQTKIRYEKLKDFCNKIEAHQASVWSTEGHIVEGPEYDCPSDTLRDQQKAMGEYLHILEIRAIIEHIDLDMPWTAE